MNRNSWDEIICPLVRGQMRWTMVLLLIGLALAACTPSAPEPTTPPTESPAAPTVEAPEVTELPTAPPQPIPTVDFAPKLVDQIWVLVAFGDAANPTVVEEGTTVTALFAADGNLSGSGGCNNYSATYEFAGDQLTVSPIATTLMACDKGMEQESEVLSALQNAQSIAFTTEGRLEISYDSGTGTGQKLIYAPGQTSLVSTVWVLESLGDPGNPTGVEIGTIITAIFSPEETVNGSAGCNTYSAGYSVQDNQIQVQPPASTMMACPQGMEQEAAYLAALAGAETYQINGPRLEISYAGGAGVLRYNSQNLTLENTLWTLAAMNGESNNIGLVPVTALFDLGAEPHKGAVGGVAMCNNYNGSYTIDQDLLTVENLAATKISCPDPLMQAEATYLELLGSAQTYEVLGQTLTIASENGTLTYVANRAPLENTYWRLTSLGPIDAPQTPVPGADFTAQFVRQPNVPSGVIVGATGCNDYNATYIANVNEIKVNLPARTNNTGCASGLPEQEQQYFLALNAASEYRILGDNLQIPYGGGQMLSFTAFVPQAAPAPSGGPLTVLNGTRWWLVTIGNELVVSLTEVTADFAISPDGVTGTISGNSGCNSYTAPITGVFQVGPAATTKMMCTNPPGVMEQESSYLAMLATANSFSLNYNQLVIGTLGGPLVYYNSPVPMVPVAPSLPIATPPTLEPGVPSLPIATPPTATPVGPSQPIATLPTAAPVEPSQPIPTLPTAEPATPSLPVPGSTPSLTP